MKLLTINSLKEDWDQASGTDKETYVETITEYLNFKDETKVDFRDVLNLIEENFKKPEYHKSKLAFVFSDSFRFLK